MVWGLGSYSRLTDSCIPQLKAHGPSRTCQESKEEKEVPGLSKPPRNYEVMLPKPKKITTRVQCGLKFWGLTQPRLVARLVELREIGILSPNNQRQHRTLHIQKGSTNVGLSPWRTAETLMLSHGNRFAHHCFSCLNSLRKRECIQTFSADKIYHIYFQYIIFISTIIIYIFNISCFFNYYHYILLIKVFFSAGPLRTLGGTLMGSSGSRLCAQPLES